MPPAASSALHRALVRAEGGRSVSVDEAEALIGARGEDLARLMTVAARIRDLGTGERITYSRKVFVPLTMLCRDRCHYCTFVKPPARIEEAYLSIEEVVAIADAGRRAGCKEALFTLGDRPEDRYPEAAAWLSSRGYDSTLDYVRAAAIAVIERTGLLRLLHRGGVEARRVAHGHRQPAQGGVALGPRELLRLGDQRPAVLDDADRHALAQQRNA